MQNILLKKATTDRADVFLYLIPTKLGMDDTISEPLPRKTTGHQGNKTLLIPTKLGMDDTISEPLPRKTTGHQGNKTLSAYFRKKTSPAFFSVPFFFGILETFLF